MNGPLGSGFHLLKKKPYSFDEERKRKKTGEGTGIAYKLMRKPQVDRNLEVVTVQLLSFHPCGY